MNEATTVRAVARHERAAVLDLLDEWISRDFFGRYFEHDPAFRDDLCFVATAGGRIVSTLQVFEKLVRVDSATLRVGGVGNVFTTAACRARGLASQVLTHAIAAMEAQGFDLSLLFATRLEFYGRHGWSSHLRHLIFIDPERAVLSTISHRYVIEGFEPERDLDAVMGVYNAYCERLPGTTVRDRRYWLGQLRYAGNTDEDFLIARTKAADGPIVAYARGTPLFDYYVIMEHGCLPGHESALTDLVCRLHGAEGSALPGTLAHLATEPKVREALTARGLTHRVIEDVFWMWRVISPTRLAQKLGLTPAEVDREDFWMRLFPPERSLFWTSDRF